MKERKLMKAISDEIWIKILETGIYNSILKFDDICSFSECCKNFNKLSSQETIWSTLLTIDFPRDQNQENDDTPEATKKSVYMDRLKKNIKQKWADLRSDFLKHERALIADDLRISKQRRKLMVFYERTKRNKANGDSVDSDFEQRFDLIEYLQKSLKDRFRRAKVLHAKIMAGQDIKFLEVEDCDNISDDYSVESSEAESEESSEEESEEGSGEDIADGSGNESAEEIADD
ncbi:hypothetical protein IFM89_011716 [Coptis chinensis]|uniref:F-box domain-containing protein n=1 Tax=Coptis chinensis TaxID=261450 RepID=A0A835IYF6_9MAGN|nr:hypothetical protein IFM89_011716 [Coptis chinensis]